MLNGWASTLDNSDTQYVLIDYLIREKASHRIQSSCLQCTCTQQRLSTLGNSLLEHYHRLLNEILLLEHNAIRKTSVKSTDPYYFMMSIWDKRLIVCS